MRIGQKDTQMPMVDHLNPRRARASAIFFILIILTVSALYLLYAWYRYDNSASIDAIQLAESLASLLHPEHILSLSGNPEDLNTPEYLLIKSNLIQLVETTNPIRFAYLMSVRGDRLIILADSELPDSPDYSPPGQVYEEADASYWAPFSSGETVQTDKITDRWGTWISVLVPIHNSADGSIIAIFGIDYSASEWISLLRKQMIPDFIIVFCLQVIMAVLFYTTSQKADIKRIATRLAYEEGLYHNVFSQAPIGIAIVNDKKFTRTSDFGDANINPMFEQILGRTSLELEKTHWPAITHPDDLQADLEKFEQFKNGEINGYSMEKRFIRPDGSCVWTNMKISPLKDISNSHSMHLCLLEDISIRKEAEESLQESERSKSVLLSNLPGMAYRCKNDREWTMQFVSDGCHTLTGYIPEDLIHNRVISFNELITPEYRKPLWDEWQNSIAKKQPFKYEYEISTATGERKWVLEMGEGIYDDNGEVIALEGIILDISDRKVMENNLRYINEHDAWTGLLNRRYLVNTIKRRLLKRGEAKRAIININLSAIHLLTISYGFIYSQAVLKKVADALRKLRSKNRELFNIEEYRLAFFVGNYKDTHDLSAFCEVIARTLESVLTIERIGGGIGVIEIDESHDHDIEILLRKSLVASEKAIQNTESEIGICFFDREMEEQILREETIKRELDEVAADQYPDRLYLQFQPILDLKSNCICGFEALARFSSHSLGPVSPLEFIPLAEETKLIIPLGERIIRKAMQFLVSLKQKSLDSVSVSINITAVQLIKKGFVSYLHELIREMDINPANIVLEITESVFSSNYQEINHILGELKNIGITIAIDDFGTQYSSLARVRELNVNCLKIDRYFIDKLMTIHPQNAISGDIVSMAHKLGYYVIAEGVEYEKQLEYLIEQNCDRVQGYLIGKPLNEQESIEFLTKRKTRAMK